MPAVLRNQYVINEATCLWCHNLTHNCGCKRSPTQNENVKMINATLKASNNAVKSSIDSGHTGACDASSDAIQAIQEGRYEDAQKAHTRASKFHDREATKLQAAKDEGDDYDRDELDQHETASAQHSLAASHCRVLSGKQTPTTNQNLTKRNHVMNTRLQPLENPESFLGLPVMNWEVSEEEDREKINKGKSKAKAKPIKVIDDDDDDQDDDDSADITTNSLRPLGADSFLGLPVMNFRRPGSTRNAKASGSNADVEDDDDREDDSTDDLYGQLSIKTGKRSDENKKVSKRQNRDAQYDTPIVHDEINDPEDDLSDLKPLDYTDDSPEITEPTYADRPDGRNKATLKRRSSKGYAGAAEQEARQRDLENARRITGNASDEILALPTFNYAQLVKEQRSK